MQKIEVHPFSLIAGAAMALLFLFACSSGSKTPSVSPAQNVNVINPVRLDPSAEVAINSLPTVQLDSSTSVSVSSLPKVELDASTAVRVSSLPNVHLDPATTVKISDLPAIKVKGSPTHDDFVIVEEGNLYTVPQGKVMVLTGVVRVAGTDWALVTINVDGAPQLRTSLSTQGNTAGGTGLISKIPRGLHAEPGQVVGLSNTHSRSTTHRLLGYLEDA